MALLWLPRAAGGQSFCSAGSVLTGMKPLLVWGKISREETPAITKISEIRGTLDPRGRARKKKLWPHCILMNFSPPSTTVLYHQVWFSCRSRNWMNAMGFHLSIPHSHKTKALMERSNKYEVRNFFLTWTFCPNNVRQGPKPRELPSFQKVQCSWNAPFLHSQLQVCKTCQQPLLICTELHVCSQQKLGQTEWSCCEWNHGWAHTEKPSGSHLAWATACSSSGPWACSEICPSPEFPVWSLQGSIPRADLRFSEKVPEQFLCSYSL